MGMNSLDLSFDFKPVYVPKTISQFLGEVSRIGNLSDRVLKLDDYVNRLESEMGKIVAFERELPLCILLINDAIFALKQEANQFRKQFAEPVLEEFIPLKKSCDDSGKDEIKNRDRDSGDRKNWLSSTQLWKNDDDQLNIKPNQDQNRNSVLGIKKRAEEAPVIDNLYHPCKPSPKSLMPFKGYLSSFPAVGMRKENKEEYPVSSRLSLITPGVKNQREELRLSGILSSKISSNKRLVSCLSSNVQPNLFAVPQPPQQQQNSRKQRRCWSPELHRRFVNALQQLGGTQAATPKQIRELMQVDGLTNDEVKSHLQKYRLHTRKLPTSTAPTANQSLVVLEGGLWNESSKKSNSPNGSPEGPFQLNVANEGTSTTWGDSMDEDDEKSECFSRKSNTHTSGKVET